MSKRKSVIIMLIIFLAIGFATVSTTLVLNGILDIGENKDDFDIIFIKAKLNGVNKNNFISEDKKHINFVSNELKTLEDKAVLTYEVTNTSRNYDADVQVTCTAGTTDLITFEYTPHQMEVLAGETKTGTFTASMFKLVDTSTEVTIECTLTATAKEREELGKEYIAPFSKSGVMMMVPSPSSDQKYWAYKNHITKVIFEDRLEPHETTEDLIFDVSTTQDKSVIAYLVPNGETLTSTKDANNNVLEDTTAYTLYIQGETGVKSRGCSELFSGFNNLLKIENMKYLDTSSITVMYSMFANCTNLTNIDLSSLYTSNVKSMSAMFHNCKSLSNIDLSSLDTSNVTDMDNMFYNCASLTSLDLSSIDTSKVTNMSQLFSGCSKLIDLNLKSLNTSSVTNMSYMFSGCRAITELNLSHLNTSNVTNMGGFFAGCEKLTNLDLSPLNTNKVTDMSRMFHNCSKLINIDLSPLDTSNVKTMEWMFDGCSGLISLDLSPLDTSEVTDMGVMFRGCSKLTNLDLNPLDTTNVTDMGGMFAGCSGLTDLDLKPLNTHNVTSMAQMFENCTALTTIDLSPLDTSNVTIMNFMFRGCTSLIELDLTPLDTSNLTNVYSMFSNCNSLNAIDMSTFRFDLITSSKYCFENMPSTATIKVKDVAAQEWILALSETDRPSTWTTDNVVIKETV